MFTTSLSFLQCVLTSLYITSVFFQSLDSLRYAMSVNAKYLDVLSTNQSISVNSYVA